MIYCFVRLLTWKWLSSLETCKISKCYSAFTKRQNLLGFGGMEIIKMGS